MAAVLCGVTYTRPSVLGDGVLSCQYIVGHTAERHSFYAIQCQDDADMEAMSRPTNDPVRLSAQQFIDAINLGLMDNYLEAILTAGHGRKLARRGERGFRNPQGPTV